MPQQIVGILLDREPEEEALGCKRCGWGGRFNLPRGKFALRSGEQWRCLNLPYGKSYRPSRDGTDERNGTGRARHRKAPRQKAFDLRSASANRRGDQFAYIVRREMGSEEPHRGHMESPLLQFCE